MRNVAVVTDSGANLPKHLKEQLDITVIPLWLRMAGTLLRDEVEISAQAFYERMRAGEGPPSTSQPSVGEFLEVYGRLAKKAQGILSIHLPARLSGTLSSAQAAASQLASFPIRIIDSGSACMGQGFAVLEAARLAAKGTSLEEVASTVERMLPRIQLLAVLDTLEYIVRGGRLKVAANLMRPLLRTRVLVLLQAGQLRLLRLAHTRAKALAALMREMAARVGSAPIHVAILQADARERAARLRQEITERFQCVEVYTTGLTPVLGAHSGPGVLGVAFYPEGDKI